MKSVTIKQLESDRTKFLQGISRIDTEVADLQTQIEKLKLDRVATAGAVQYIDSQIARSLVKPQAVAPEAK